jgi:hypothetical protein
VVGDDDRSAAAPQKTGPHGIGFALPAEEEDDDQQDRQPPKRRSDRHPASAFLWAARGLGIASLVLGSVTAVFTLIQQVGSPGMPPIALMLLLYLMSGLGLILGVVGLIMAIMHRGSAISFPIAGSVASLVACFLPFAAFAPQRPVGPQGLQRPVGPQALKMGEEILFDDSTWTVLDAVDMGRVLKSNNMLKKDAVTNGRFIRVHYRVLNRTKKEARFIDLPKLIDSQGREFNQYDEQAFYIPEGAKTIALEALPASIPKEFYAIYEVPADARQPRFEAKSLDFFPEKKLVDLGL